MKITICGAGRGGTTLAADFSLMGHDVTLYQHPDFAQSLEPIRAAGGLTITGNTISKKNGLATPKLSTDAAEAVKGSDVVFFCLAAFGHENMMTTVIPHMEDGQIGVVTTGYFSSLRFRDLIHKPGRKLYWVETELLPYLTDNTSPSAIGVMAVKSALGFASFPASDMDHVTPILKQLLPMLEPMKNVLEVTAASLNPICHMPLILLNLATIDNTPDEGTFNMYGVGNSPMAGKLIEALDREKIEFGKLFGIEMETAMERDHKIYPNSNPEGKGMYELIKEEETSPDFTLHPYEYIGITNEDIPFMLVPMATIARNMGKVLPLNEAFINIFGAAYGKNYWETGVTAEKLGLDKLSAQEIADLVDFSVRA